LDLRTRMIVRVAAASDVLVRTALSSAVTASSLPWALNSAPRSEHERLEFYDSVPRDPSIVFRRPAADIEVGSERSSTWSPGAPQGSVRTLRFQSPFVALNPALRDRSVSPASRSGAT
jgi:hypothetical protein